MIKIINTFYCIDAEGIYEKFIHKFIMEYLSYVEDKLEATPSLGLGFYSKKYDLLISGAEASKYYYVVESFINCYDPNYNWSEHKIVYPDDDTTKFK